MICPKCGKALVKKDKSWICENRHTYDIARQGYVNLIPDGSVHGDSKEMVQARHKFLQKGYYEVLKKKLEELIAEFHPEVLIDLGCGEGYYTSSMSKYADECFGIDLSRDALKIASRNDKKSQYIVASIFHLPFSDKSADCMTNIFAPAPVEEGVRILKNEGIYIRVAPHAFHLYELKKKLYDEVYENEIELLEDKRLKLVCRLKAEDMIQLENNEDISALFMMTPYYWKSSKKVSEKVSEMNALTTRIAFDIQIYRKVIC